FSNVVSTLVRFFLGLLTNLDLHSFPTRRSSDLARDLEDVSYGVVGRADDAKADVVLGQALLRLDKGIEGRGVEKRDLREIDHDPDRKSTRLNSSHQIISYAVFCLKKKKQQ